MVLFLMKVAKKKDPIFVHFATDGEWWTCCDRPCESLANFWVLNIHEGPESTTFRADNWIGSIYPSVVSCQWSRIQPNLMWVLVCLFPTLSDMYDEIHDILLYDMLPFWGKWTFLPDTNCPIVQSPHNICCFLRCHKLQRRSIALSNFGLHEFSLTMDVS
jgi:hypothetical protein